MTTGLVGGFSSPTVIRLVARGQLRQSDFVAYRFDPEDAERANVMFARERNVRPKSRARPHAPTR